MPPNTVVVSRPSRWGNPFEIGKYVDVTTGLPATREQVVRMFDVNLRHFPNLMDVARRELRGDEQGDRDVGAATRVAVESLWAGIYETRNSECGVRNGELGKRRCRGAEDEIGKGGF